MIKKKILKNKITLVTEQIPYVQSAAIGIWVKVGAVDEMPECAGISHFIEHMMFKGTEQRTAKEIAESIDRLGGQFNAFTGKEATCYYVKTLSSNLKSATEILVDMLENSKFDEEEMNRERKVICEEIKMTQDTPDELVHETIVEEVFRGNPLGNSIIGTKAILEGINHDKIYSYYKKEYTRDSIVVSIAGNFDETEMEEYLSKQFMDLVESKPVKIRTHLPYKKSLKTITKDIEQSHLCMATKGISLTDQRYYDFTVLNNILGGSMSSRLFQNIREQKGLAYSIFSMLGCHSSDGYFGLYAGVAHDKIKNTVDALREEFDKLKSGEITKDELDMAKEQIKSSYIFGQENVSSRMFAMGKNQLLIDQTFTAEEVIEAIDAVNMKSIREAIDAVSDIDNYSMALVTNDEFDLENL